jgi:hypothetical protein
MNTNLKQTDKKKAEAAKIFFSEISSRDSAPDEGIIADCRTKNFVLRMEILEYVKRIEHNYIQKKVLKYCKRRERIVQRPK